MLRVRLYYNNQKNYQQVIGIEDIIGIVMSILGQAGQRRLNGNKVHRNEG